MEECEVGRIRHSRRGGRGRFARTARPPVASTNAANRVALKVTSCEEDSFPSDAPMLTRGERETRTSPKASLAVSFLHVFFVPASFTSAALEGRAGASAFAAGGGILFAFSRKSHACGKI